MIALLRIFLCILLPIPLLADSYSVRIVTSHHVNLVDSRFMSFTVDPKYLFSSSDKYASKDCICMASALTPAYLRIAGPSTSNLTFHNTTISIDNQDFGFQTDPNFSLDFDSPKKFPLRSRKLAVTYKQWRRFIQWSRTIGFDLVFALNNEEKMASGMWDANTALSMLTEAEKAKVGHIFWELGYECSNQSIEEYLNDLQTLSVIIETFPPGRTGEWQVVGGDVTKCLQADSKSDFKDYLTLSSNILDALLLNGNSSSYELERMTERDRQKLQRVLSRSDTPLWLTDSSQQIDGLARAADWLVSLGYYAKIGFAVHFRELEEEELYEPTLSFYMALLFKNLVGERVLDVQMDPEQAVLFAHCTSLRHKSVPRAVTLYGANIDEEPARFSLKLSRREEGGDILQFILGLDRNGNIEVNGRAMYHEGDIKPVVKRVPPYKTLLINLPAKSFGFWVLANTKIEACHDTNQTFVEAETISDENNRIKRSINDDFEDLTKTADVSYDFEDDETLTTINKELRSRISDINKDLNRIHKIFKNNRDGKRVKREDDSLTKKSRRPRYRSERWVDDINISPKRLLGNILEKARQSVSNIKNTIGIGKSRLSKNRLNKRHSKTSKFNKRRMPEKKYNTKTKPKFTTKNIRQIRNNKVNSKKTENTEKKSDMPTEIQEDIAKELKTSIENTLNAEVRKKRDVEQDEVEITAENDIDVKDKEKLWKMLKRIHKELNEEDLNNDSVDSGIVLKTELLDDRATIHVRDSDHGVLKSTVRNLLHVFEDLNNNVNKLWNAVDILD